MKNEANGTNLALGGGACMAISFIPGGSSQDSEPPRHHTAPRGKLQGDKTRERGRQLAPARSLCHGRPGAPAGETTEKPSELWSYAAAMATAELLAS